MRYVGAIVIYIDAYHVSTVKMLILFVDVVVFTS